MSRAETFYLGPHCLRALGPSLWRIEPVGPMRVGVNLVGSRAMLERLREDRSVEQAVRVAQLPGVLDPVLTMPDIHQGYGFPIGGVAAFHAKNGVVSPGGVGYDINCGVRLLRTSLSHEEVDPEKLRGLVESLFATIPTGVGSRRGDLKLAGADWNALLTRGAAWAVDRGYGTRQDLQAIESRGSFPGADPEAVSERARERGANQLGTLGSGNHFVEVQRIDEIYDSAAAEAFGLAPGQITVTVHTGSRGLGYQVCADYLERTLSAARKAGLTLPDRELAAAPIHSPEGQAYLGAMAAAANFAFANRQIITHWVREAFREHFGTADLPLVYDVCHNIARFETLAGGRNRREVLVHRKGATRALPPGHPDLTPAYRDVGQPVLVPGDMGRYSYVLAGNPGSLEKSFASACHGAGRELSRSQAKKQSKGRDIASELSRQGIVVRAAGRATVVEEMPDAYKDVSLVTQAMDEAGITRRVARLRPLGVIKG